MKRPRELNESHRLLDAVLVDDAWETLNSSLKREAVLTLRAQGRKRQFRLWLGQAACLAMVLGVVSWWHASAPQNTVRSAVKAGPAAANQAGTRFISEAEMISMFPPGSCVVAEVNGQKELVFFDAKKAKEGYAAVPQ